MKFTKVASVLMAVLLVATAGAAAMPGNAPDKAQAGQADGNYENGSDAEQAANETAMDDDNEMKPDHAGNGSDAGAAAADDKRGPPTDMPEQVPDFVTEVHELINQKLDGTLEDLGDALSAATPGEDADDEQSADGDADEQDSEEMNDSDDSDETDDQSDADQTDADDSDDSESDSDGSDEQDTDDSESSDTESDDSQA